MPLILEERFTSTPAPILEATKVAANHVNTIDQSAMTSIESLSNGKSYQITRETTELKLSSPVNGCLRELKRYVIKNVIGGEVECKVCGCKARTCNMTG